MGVSGQAAGEAGNVGMHPVAPPVDALALDVALLETLLLETLLLDVPPPDPPEPEGSLSDEQACAASRVRAQVITAMDLMFMVFFTSSSQSLISLGLIGKQAQDRSRIAGSGLDFTLVRQIVSRAQNDQVKPAR